MRWNEYEWMRKPYSKCETRGRRSVRLELSLYVSIVMIRTVRFTKVHSLAYRLSPWKKWRAICICWSRVVVNTSASYSGCHRLKSRPNDRLSWLRVFVVFISPFKRCRDSTLKLGQIHFIIHLSPFHSNYIVFVTRKASLNEQVNTYSNVYVARTPEIRLN
jgi:hypothetical protein